MIYTIQNKNVAVEVDSLGAQLMSLKTPDQVEYLWQGDPAYWRGRSPILFPFVGRFAESKYQYNGIAYPAERHGFVRDSEFVIEEHDSDRIVMCLSDNTITREMYPFSFSFRVTYSLIGATVLVSWQVDNRNDCVMPFGIGGHPGFNVPLLAGECFEDYVLEFPVRCFPDRIGFSSTAHLNGVDCPYKLEDNIRIHLRHDLFDHEAIVLKNAPREVTLRNASGSRGVKVRYPDMPYIGFWHMPKTAAPYVCIEPWVSLPGRHETFEEITCKSDMIQLAPHGSWQTQWSLELI